MEQADPKRIDVGGYDSHSGVRGVGPPEFVTDSNLASTPQSVGKGQGPQDAAGKDQERSSGGMPGAVHRSVRVRPTPVPGSGRSTHRVSHHVFLDSESWRRGIRALQELVIHFILGLGVLGGIKGFEWFIHLCWPSEDLVWLKGSPWEFHVDWIFNIMDTVFLLLFMGVGIWKFVFAQVGRTVRSARVIQR